MITTRFLRVVLKMYKVTCVCGESEVIKLPGQYNFSFDVINELYANLVCCICNQRRFEIKFIYKHDECIND